MISLLEDILIIGKNNANKVAFDPVTETICENQRSHHCKSHVKYDFELALMNCGVDIKFMRQIVINLFSNTLKYAEFRSVIGTSIFRAYNTIVFKVSDNIIGISKKDQNESFEPFYRGGNVEAVAGNYCGLAIFEKGILF
jgi:signal transduction histidine kinase